MGDLFGWAWDGLKAVGSWMGDNPELTQFIGGAAMGVANYYASQEQMRHERQMAERAERFKERKASSGNPEYGSHLIASTGGTGLLANPLYRN